MALVGLGICADRTLAYTENQEVPIVGVGKAAFLNSKDHLV